MLLLHQPGQKLLGLLVWLVVWSLTDGSLLQFLDFEIQDPSPLANRQQAPLYNSFEEG